MKNTPPLRDAVWKAFVHTLSGEERAGFAEGVTNVLADSDLVEEGMARTGSELQDLRLQAFAAVWEKYSNVYGFDTAMQQADRLARWVACGVDPGPPAAGDPEMVQKVWDGASFIKRPAAGDG